jgi:hypothetical protein
LARSGFVPNFKGYLATLNDDEAYRHCDAIGQSVCQTANMAGHGEYAYDTIRGKVRIHTRVKTADEESKWRERHYRTLAAWAARR